MTRKEKGGKRGARAACQPCGPPSPAVSERRAAPGPEEAPRGDTQTLALRTGRFSGPSTHTFVFLGLPQGNNLKPKTCHLFAAFRVEKLR